MYLSAQTKCGPCRVHSHVSAAYDSNLLACHDGGVIRIIEGLHQIAPGQVLIGGEYAVGCLSRDSHEHRKSGAGTDEDCLEAFLFHQLVNGSRLADHYIGLKLHAQLFNFFNLFLHYLLFGKTEFRDPVDQYAAQFMKSLKNRHLIAKLRQVSGAGKTGRAGTDDSHLVAIALFSLLRFDIVLQGVIRNKTLQFSDGNRLAFDPADTFALALGFLGADTSADRRQGGGLSDHLVGALDIAVFHLGDKARDIDGYRTSLDTFGILTVQAAGSLFHGLLLIVSVTYFFKIRRSDLCVLLSHRNSL